jgi:hypothetical protein
LHQIASTKAQSFDNSLRVTGYQLCKEEHQPFLTSGIKSIPEVVLADEELLSDYSPHGYYPTLIQRTFYHRFQNAQDEAEEAAQLHV